MKKALRILLAILIICFLAEKADSTNSTINLLEENITTSSKKDNADSSKLITTSSELLTVNFSYEIINCTNLQFTDLSSCSPGYQIVSWLWDFGDGVTDTLQNPTHQYPSNTTPGGDIYSVKLVVIADSIGFTHTDSLTLPLTVPSLPDIFVYIDPNKTCLGDTTYFFGYSGFPIEQWYWDFGDGGTSIQQTPSYCYHFPGTYTVPFTVTDVNGCQNSVSEEVNVNPNPNALFEVSNTCFGDSTYFTNLSYSQNGYVSQWHWNFGDGTTSIEEDPVHLYQNNQTYYVSLVVTDNTGCSATYTSEVLIDSLPTASFANTIGSCDIPTYFNGVEYSGGEFIERWWWNFGDITSEYNTDSIQNPSHLYSSYDSTYQVELIVMNHNGCYNTVVQDVYVAPCINAGFILPQDSIFAGNEICFIDTSLLAINNILLNEWFWDFGDGTTEVYNNFHDSIYHEYENEGIYQVELIITASFDTIILTSTSVEELTVYPPSGIYETTIGNIDFSIIPNPANGNFTINSDVFIGNTAVVSIISGDGSIVYQNSYRVTNNKLNININGESFASGIYTVMIKSEKYLGVSKLIINN